MLHPPALAINQMLLVFLWVVAVIRIIWDQPELRLISGLVLGLYIALAIGKIRKRMQMLIISLTAAAISFAAIFDGWHALWQGMEHSVILSLIHI